jgi:hypothetical protein
VTPAPCGLPVRQHEGASGRIWRHAVRDVEGGADVIEQVDPRQREPRRQLDGSDAIE